jgi:hypothetical protein
MALISPGLELSVTDESAYVPGAVGTVPLVFLATAQDKIYTGTTVAAGTSKANAAQLQAFTSQREIVTQLGAPIFKQSASGTPIHASPLNEYGLMSSYSALGLSNRLYAIRADVNLTELEATSVRPIGDPTNGTIWLDLGLTDWGIYEWNATTSKFVKKVPIIIDTDEEINPATLGTGNYPQTGLGSNGDYAIVTVGSKTATAQNRIYKKDYIGYWRRLGIDNWYSSNPSIQATVANPTLVTAETITLNGVTITLSGTTVTTLKAAFDAAAGLTGITTFISNGTLQIFADTTAKSNGVDADGKLAIANGTGTMLARLGITAGTYNGPDLFHGTYVDVPAWRASDTDPRPSGSVWIKTSTLGSGMNLNLKKYNIETDKFTAEAVTVGEDFAKIGFALDPNANTFSTPFGTKVAVHRKGGTAGNDIRLFQRRAVGKAISNGTPTGLSGGGTITVTTTKSGFDTFFTYSLTMGVTVTTANDWATRFSSYGIPEVSCTANADGTITITHETGGVVTLKDVTGTMVSGAGFTSANFLDDGAGTITLSNWNLVKYEASITKPYKEPVNGTYWYYGDATTVDIMINDNGWKGYKNLSNDARGYNLGNTDPGGVVVTASKPISQSDGTALVAGDLWLDTSDLINYPKLYRYTSTSEFVAIDATDRFSQNGIAFADARWDGAGTTDVVASNMLTSNYTDLDAPNYKLYPRGLLLWNTRRSGFNVKKFANEYFNDNSFPGKSLPAIKDTWVSVSGLMDSQAPFMGTAAQRNMVVKAMKSAVDANIQIREEQFAYNLITAPGFPEVIPNMVALNNDRKNTAFVIGDTPMHLPANSIAFANWANNTNGDGLSTADPYLAVYYPSGKTNDLSGNTIVMPPSHMALRTYIRNDNVSYQWFAPAGVRRGLIDNAADIGYVNQTTGGFVRNAINNGLRDALYENRINPFTILPGVGLVCWGQKTRNPVASSMDRVNVARLVNYIRTILANVGNAFLFEPNDKITRDQIKNIIEGAINDLIAKRGIYDYLVVCDETNNTPTRIARNELYVDIAIEPMKAVEFIYIPIRLKNPGDIAAGV